MNHQCMGNDPGLTSRSNFSAPESTHRQLWSIVLAGGNGDRISELIRNWLGRSVPKQYCAFTGRMSMLQHTLLRADALSPRQRQIILIAEAHRSVVQAQLAERGFSEVVVQPANRGTLPGMFLPLTHVYARDPEATVAIFPSDHFIYPEPKFRSVMERAIHAAEALPGTLMLVGVPAHSLELEYGWIFPGDRIWGTDSHPVRAVSLFLEKPDRCRAVEAMARGALWNTMIIVVKARTLWQLGCTFYPEIMKLFTILHGAIGTSREEATVQSIYEIMPVRDFSSSLLTEAIDQMGVVSMTDVLWCDWGRKERILETLRVLGKKPNFPRILAGEDRHAMKEAKNVLMEDDEFADGALKGA